MGRTDKTRFQLQYLLGRIFVFIAAPVITIAVILCGYRVHNLTQMRQSISASFKKHKGPWLICSNHLTMIDSVFITYVMFPFYRYMFQYRLMPWNIPEKANLYRIHPLVAVLCYLLKCLPIERGGSRDSLNKSLEKCAYMLSRGENLTIFPEGTRARDGRINTTDFPYSVGRFIQMIPDCRVMCIYLRGDTQTAYSDLPALNETFYVAVTDFKPVSTLKGLKAQRDFARQIIEKLSAMEKTYFDARGK